MTEPSEPDHVSRETDERAAGEGQVSRETTDWDSPPPEAEAVFGDRLASAAGYAELLGTEGVLRGLIGPREASRLWERHLLNSAVLGEVVGSHLTVCDVGSGAGLPGVPLAIARPDLRVTLVEPLLRRTTFLTEVVERLELDNVEVVRGRAEELAGVRDFDVVTSRAVAPLERLAGWSMPLVREGGLMLAMKGASARDELDRAAEAVARCGGTDPEVLVIGSRVLPTPTYVVRVRAGRPSRLQSPTPQRTRRKGRKR